ncbi:MAG: hypothetical protein PSN35_06115 [Candidatus Thioglobus sp.]|uniref:hypothetical protein n=1 Tax=Candidatus Thioglobus sp. TaxID=2026721 RepID=UPI002614CCCB|nr:hypothetical protein [Candidatus Thioglobus sp.]MDC9727390.1 hypothetical protein [Candidatus Thioglobus sp.]
MKALLLTAALLASTTTIANEEGKELHDESCVACHLVTHDDSFYTRDNSKMSTHFDLRRQVSMCASNFELGWFPEEEKAVLDYLNTKYYKFKE